jgi:hypothetical protein
VLVATPQQLEQLVQYKQQLTASGKYDTSSLQKIVIQGVYLGHKLL